ncbi:polysaccharide lyase 8 family protein [Bacteroides sp. UBA939]|uniref:polysaccharide lyase 8 family protein n=1 Tax=Bacteroides sp. UBA939 TaxID=1946092 RepID=UPI0025BFD2A3|nr:polysaccharide lyase 8 family protein [Bacteroides sp. UBA939]
MKTTARLIISVIIGSLISAKAHTAIAVPNTADNSNEFEVLMQKIRLDFANNPSIDEDLKSYNDTDGSFTDVDYSSIQRTNWPPIVHIDRLSAFAFAYTNPENKYYKDEVLFAKIQKGLEYWHERNPWCHNWWYNQIAEPQQTGILLIQMRAGEKHIPAELEEKILERIKKDGGHPAKWTGANRTDIALHWIYRACLSEDEADLSTALENAYSPIVYTTKEGFQHDNSYFQHGTQLYIGGYGDEILKGVTQIAMYTRGTRYAIPSDKLALLSKFMRETYYSTIRGQYMLFDVLGRGVSRPGITNKAHTALFAKRMIELDPAHAKEYEEIILRLSGKRTTDYALSPKHTHYFRGDYTLHVRPAYTFDVRMVSTRTKRCEYGNGENLKTYFMSDGCTNIVSDGNEYADIFPVWNWTRIPGVTAPQVEEIPMATSDWQTPGTSTFAGGVSDSLYGASAYSYTDTYAGINTSARKAWFFFDDEVVCLGAGIHSTSEYPVYTTVNQCLAASSKVLLYHKKKPTEITQGNFNYTSPEWILHNKTGYLFPDGGKVFVANQQQTGSWYDINHTAPKDSIQKDIFTICIDHGMKPSDATYAYIIIPGMQTVDGMKQYQQEKNIKILTNTENLQAVSNEKAGILQMIFYQSGEFIYKDLTIKADKACALIVKMTNRNKIKLHIADPGQTESNITLEIRTRKQSKTINCDYRNSGIYAGHTKVFDISL